VQQPMPASFTAPERDGLIAGILVRDSARADTSVSDRELRSSSSSRSGAVPTQVVRVGDRATALHWAVRSWIRLLGPARPGPRRSPTSKTTVRFPAPATTPGRGSHQRNPFPNLHDRAGADRFLSEGASWISAARLRAMRRPADRLALRRSPVVRIRRPACTNPCETDQPIGRHRHGADLRPPHKAAAELRGERSGGPSVNLPAGSEWRDIRERQHITARCCISATTASARIGYFYPGLSQRLSSPGLGSACAGLVFSGSPKARAHRANFGLEGFVGFAFACR
jgi:hypothetical protein